MGIEADTMKKLIAFSFLAVGAVATPVSANDLFGTRWLTQNGQAEIAIASCVGGSLCGTIARVVAPAGVFPKDTRNPDASKRNQPLVGVKLIQGFKLGKDGKWTGGTIYNPQDGRTYRSELARKPDGSLAVKGCVGPLCQTQVWKPVTR